MIKELTLKQRFERLQPWATRIFIDIKKEVKGEILLKNRGFVSKYFPKKTADKVTANELVAACYQEVAVEGNADFCDWVVSRWILKNIELYEYFVKELTGICPKFEEIKEISDDKGESMMQKACALFGASGTYIFSLLNSVAFSDNLFAKLEKAAMAELQSQKQSSVQEIATEKTAAELKCEHEKEMLKLTEKYENKLQAVLRKYAQDVDGLKKQVSLLQKRLGENVALR